MRLETNCFADIKIRGLNKAKIYVKEVRPEERRYVVLMIEGPSTCRSIWLREKSIEEIVGKPKQAPADLRSWPADAAAAFLLDEYQSLAPYSKERFATQFKPLDLQAWSEYCMHCDKLRMMFNHSKERANLVKALLNIRTSLKARRILPGEKVVSRSVRRKVKQKERMRSDYSKAAPRPERVVGYSADGPSQPLEDPTSAMRRAFKKKMKKSNTPGILMTQAEWDEAKAKTKKAQILATKKVDKYTMRFSAAPQENEEEDIPF